MTIAFYLLRTFWKPLAVLALALVIFASGYRQAKRACATANLRAEIIELRRQANASNAVLARAAEESKTRLSEIEILNEKVEFYEQDIGENSDCILSVDDAERLLLIK